MSKALARLGRWLVQRCDVVHAPALVTSSARYYVGVTMYDGLAGGDARKVWEREVAKPAPTVGTLEFWDGTECRGRYPSE